MTKMPRFDKHPLPGDSITWRNGGFTLTARIKVDDATRPGEFDCYSEEDIEGWKNDDWCYVGIVVSAEYKGWLLEDPVASLWGSGVWLDRGFRRLSVGNCGSNAVAAKVELTGGEGGAGEPSHNYKHRPGVTNDRP
jgi:hypothetical protein